MRSLFVLLVLLVLGACTSEAPGMMDAGTVQCVGTPIACPLLSSIADCSAMLGCGWTACAGDPACASIPNEAGCRGLPGCLWADRPLCRGVASPCETLSEDTCAAQRVCNWGAPNDAGLADAGALPICPADFERPAGCPAPAVNISTGCDSAAGIECDGDWTGLDPASGLPFCELPCPSGECCVPLDGGFQCVVRDGDGRCPSADIFLDGSRVGYNIDTKVFEEAACTVAEGCVGGSGERRLLNFETWTTNIGSADLFLGAVPEPEISTDIYTFSACHGHHHFRGFATYELLSSDLCCVVATGHKQAFCLADLAPYLSGVGGAFPVYDCTNQGIQRGWEDGYSVGVDCQWVDITGVPSGDYYLRVRINEEHRLLESDYTNNEVLVPVQIPAV